MTFEGIAPAGDYHPSKPFTGMIKHQISLHLQDMVNGCDLQIPPELVCGFGFQLALVAFKARLVEFILTSLCVKNFVQMSHW